MPLVNPQELSSYLTGLFRSEPEVVAAFFMGVLLTGMLALALRRWVFPRPESKKKLAKKDAEIARREAEIARKDAQIAKVEAKLASLEGRLLEKVDLFTDFPQALTTSATSVVSDSPPPADPAAALARCAQLEAENRQLVQVKQSLEQTVERLRTELAQVTSELAHTAKWLRIFDEENARLSEDGPVSKG
jgi:septal ring factor EnvC (AmiA/AmiB activator)